MKYICMLHLFTIGGLCGTEMYYANDDVFTTPFVSRILPYARFKLINRFLHFCDNNAVSVENFKTAKIESVFEAVEHRFSELYTPERDIAIDESLMLWKGRLSWKQYIKTKRSRFGIKSFSLCESSSGYLWNSCLYTGKELTNRLSSTYQFEYVASNIVVYLLKNLVGKGHRLHVDNWYSSTELVAYLLKNKTDMIGTLRKNRRGLPKEMIKLNLNKNDVINAYNDQNIMVTRWKDKKDINLISTCISGDEFVQVPRGGVTKIIPLVVHE